MGGFEKRPGKKIRQSHVLDRDKSARCCSVVKDHSTMGFKCFLWISSNKHIVNFSSMKVTAANIFYLQNIIQFP